MPARWRASSPTPAARSSAGSMRSRTTSCRMPARASRIVPPQRDVPAHEAAAIVCFVVDPGWRRRGVARALLDGALASFAARGIRVVDRLSLEGRARAPRRPTTITARVALSRAAGFDRPGRDDKDRYGRAQTLAARRLDAGSSDAASRRRARLRHARRTLAAAAFPCAALRARDRLREPAAVLALDGAAARHAVLPASRPGRRAGRASTSSPTSSPTRRSASSSPCVPRRAISPRRGSRLRIGRRRRAVVCAWRRCRCSCRRATRASLDLLSNIAGAASAGGGLAIRALGAQRARHAAFRDHWFLPGKVGDLGLALLVIWLAAQVNPGHPALRDRRSTPTFRSDPRSAVPRAAPDLVAHARGRRAQRVPAPRRRPVPRAAAARAPLRRRRGAVLIGTALLVKGIAAPFLLKPAVWEHWLTPGVSTGVAAGALLLLVAIWLPRPAQVALAAIALLSSVLTHAPRPPTCCSRARRCRCSTGRTATCSTSTASRIRCCSCGRSPPARFCSRWPAQAASWGEPRMTQEPVLSLLGRSAIVAPHAAPRRRRCDRSLPHPPRAGDQAAPSRRRAARPRRCSRC